MDFSDYFTVEADEDLPSFNASKWIGTNRTFKDVPEEVSREKRRQLQVPHYTNCQFPSKSLSVTALLALRLPKLSNAIITTKLAVWFSKDAPSSLEPKWLWERPIPSDKHLRALEREFGQMWLDGAQSIIDPRFNDGREQLPLWMVGFWREMASLIRDQDKWKHSVQWLEVEKKRRGQTQETVKLINETLIKLNTIAWNTELASTSVIASTLSLTTLLGNEWLDDDHINLMMEVLSKRVEEDKKLAKKVIIAPLTLANELHNNRHGTYLKKAGAPVLCRYEKHIKENKIDLLYFPVHVNNNHWIAAYVDFAKGRIGYGEHN